MTVPMTDHATKLRRSLQKETLERIRADRKRAPVRVAELLAMLERRIFHPDLTVKSLRRWCEQHDKNVSTRFAKELGLAPKDYILQARMELGGRMLAASDLKVWQIGLQVGYVSGHSFGRAFTRWTEGTTPSEFRRQARAAPAAETPPSPADLVRNADLHQALAGELSREDAGALIGKLEDLTGRISDVYEVPTPAIARPDVVEPLMARKLWQWIEHQPHEAQLAAIDSQAPAFHTPALFHLLCTRSLLAGREDDVRGQQLVTLAMASLPPVAQRLGKSSLYLYARAHVVAGLAFRRSGYPDDADESLAYAARMLEEMGTEPHPVVTAELCLVQSLLEHHRGNVELADDLAARGITIVTLLLEKLLALKKASTRGSEPADAPDGSVEPPS